jgi:undecaprenyl-diphosphatase
MFREIVVALFQDMNNIAMLFIIMGFILINTRSRDGNEKMKMVDAVVIGIAQALAIVPGISRSGITISTSLIRGIRRRQAFIFSFYLAVPAILGASAYELYRAGAISYAITPEMWVGTFVAAVVGYVSLAILKDTIERSNFYRFGYYCWAVGFSLVLIPILSSLF